jgi:hypothetical protein
VKAEAGWRSDRIGWDVELRREGLDAMRTAKRKRSPMSSASSWVCQTPSSGVPEQVALLRS